MNKVAQSLENTVLQIASLVLISYELKVCDSSYVLTRNRRVMSVVDFR